MPPERNFNSFPLLYWHFSMIARTYYNTWFRYNSSAYSWFSMHMHMYQHRCSKRLSDGQSLTTSILLKSMGFAAILVP
uniref:Uncharacterized protein n=1 Tax=Arundo donax TaxID=35708 RepID=A0A0A9SQV1_ARUDO